MKKIKFWQFIKEGRPTSDNSPLGNFRNVQSVRRHCLNNERVSDRYSECVSMKTLQEIFNEIIAKEDYRLITFLVKQITQCEIYGNMIINFLIQE